MQAYRPGSHARSVSVLSVSALEIVLESLSLSSKIHVTCRSHDHFPSIHCPVFTHTARVAFTHADNDYENKPLTIPDGERMPRLPLHGH